MLFRRKDEKLDERQAETVAEERLRVTQERQERTAVRLAALRAETQLLARRLEG